MNNDFFWIDTIKDMIQQKFPTVNVRVITDDEAIMFSIDDNKTYYSSEFQELITNISLELLWPRNIYNVLFIVEEGKKYGQIQFQSTSDYVAANAFLPFWESTDSTLAETVYQAFDSDACLEVA